MGNSPLKVEVRDGPYGRRNWCLIHETWWKLCDCRGEYSKTFTVPPGMVDRADRVVGSLGGYPCHYCGRLGCGGPGQTGCIA